MDQDSTESIRREIYPPSQVELEKELYDPLAFIPATTLQSLRRKKQLQAARMAFTIIVAPVLIWLIDFIDTTFFPHGPGPSRPSKSGLGVLILLALLVYIALRGLYNLMTINQTIASEHRRGLLLLHPGLQQAEAKRQIQQHDNPWPKRIIWAICVLPVLYTVLFYIALWIGIIST